VLDHPWLTIGSILIITLFLGYSIKNIGVDPDITSALPQNIPEKILYDRMNEIFPSKDMVFIAVESDSLFSLPVIRDLFVLTDSLEDLPDVYSVMSPTNVKVITGTEEGMEIREILSAPPETREELEAFRRTLYSSDLPVENLIGKKGRMAGIMVFLKNTVKPEDAAEEVMNFIEKRQWPFKTYVTGKPVLTVFMGRGIARDMGLLFPLVIVLIIVILWLSFRSARGVLLPLSVVVISNVWTLGIMALLGVPISHSTNLMPILLASVAVADGIHILHRYYDRIRPDLKPREVVLATMEELNTPVILTSVTTAIGFLALNTSRIGSIGELGGFTALGVMIAMVFSLTFIPAALSLMRFPKRLTKKEHNPIMRKIAAGYAELLVGRYRYFMLGILLIVVFCIAGFPQIVVENNTVNFLPKGHPARVAHEMVNEHFAGTTFLTVMVETDSADGVKEPRVLREMLNVQRYLESLPHVGATMSIADFVRRMNKVMHADDPAYDRIPPDTVIEKGTDWVYENGRWVEKDVTFKVPGRELVAQYLQLYEMSSRPEDLANLVNYNYQITRINAFIDTESNNVLREIDRKLRTFIHDNCRSARMELTGTSELFLAINDLIVSGQFKSIIVSLLLVTLVAAVAFRSIRIGIFNSIPLFFAMFFNFGFMGWAGVDLNIVTMLTSSIAIGVGVDYAVHFVHRYRLRLKEGSEEDAVRKTMVEAGIPIAINAFTVGLGFAVLMLSTFISVRYMGLLITLAMFTSCFGAISILPTLFLVLKPSVLKK
jgi:hypothetical protein